MDGSGSSNNNRVSQIETVLEVVVIIEVKVKVVLPLLLISEVLQNLPDKQIFVALPKSFTMWEKYVVIITTYFFRI